MNTPHILIVDDDQSLLQALPHMVALRIHGVQVDTSDSAQGALELIQEHDYDAIVSDIKMPGMDGLELLEKIQETQSEIPTLLITGHGEQAIVTQALREGAYDFINKPIDRVYFVAALHRAIQTRQLRRQVKEQQLTLEQSVQTLEQQIEERTRELLAANTAMEELVQNVQDIALLETNSFILHRTSCNLVELCQLILDKYSSKSGLTLTFACTENPIKVDIDPERISQVLINLLSNAHKYSPKGSPVTVTLQRIEDEVIGTVRDTGIGITEDILPHIFERFFRVPGAEVQAGSRASLGLGLYIAQQIVEQHSGRIEVQSTPGSGSAFSFVLPLFAPHTTEEAEDTTPVEEKPTPFHPPHWLV